jgi:hypothetical protein
MGGTLVRSYGITRAKARIGFRNLAYNMRCAVALEELLPPAARHGRVGDRRNASGAQLKGKAPQSGANQGAQRQTVGST